MPELNARCIETWKTILPDYELVCWDRERFDVESVPFVREAVSVGAGAFAADYIRLHALSTEGGIYLDILLHDQLQGSGVEHGIELWPTVALAVWVAHGDDVAVAANAALPAIRGAYCELLIW